MGGARLNRRLGRISVIAIGSALAALGVTSASSIAAAGDLFIDYDFYRDVGARWLSDGVFYSPRQLAGPYDVQLMSDVLYPPTALLLFVPAALAPAIVWWLVPIAVTLLCVAHSHPSLAGVAAMLALLCWPRAHAAYLFGNSDMWVVAAVAAGLRWGWPAVFVVMKPTLAPFAFLGIRRRSWWIALAGLGVLSLPILPLWLDYATVLQNLSAAPGYSLGSVPLMLVPLVAWASSTHIGVRGRTGRPGPRASGGDDASPQLH